MNTRIYVTSHFAKADEVSEPSRLALQVLIPSFEGERAVSSVDLLDDTIFWIALWRSAQRCRYRSSPQAPGCHRCILAFS
jgi:hypothetical protein